MPVYRLSEIAVFPDPNDADSSGLLAVGGDLSIERILIAYEKGIFPWFGAEDPILWWSPPKRMVLFPNQLKVSKSMRKVIGANSFDITVDQDFMAVITACKTAARKDQLGTWITDEMLSAYVQLFELGYAHSFECRINNQLVGGLYGLCLGRAFFGESMFSTESNASKIAFYYLHKYVIEHEFHFIDCQLHTPHLASLGAVEIERSEYLSRLNRALAFPDLNYHWTNDKDS